VSHVITDPTKLEYIRLVRALPADARVEFLRLLRVVADNPPAKELRAAVLRWAGASGIEEAVALEATRARLGPRLVSE
jgi:hypothetical protein